jgi:hypothetical protein
MVLALLVGLGCGGDGVPYKPRSAYTPVVGPAPLAADDAASAPFAGSLGAPRVSVTPVIVGVTTTTREGSGGPPIAPPGAVSEAPPPHQMRGPDHDAHRITTEPSPHGRP